MNPLLFVTARKAKPLQNQKALTSLENHEGFICQIRLGAGNTRLHLVREALVDLGFADHAPITRKGMERPCQGYLCLEANITTGCTHHQFKLSRLDDPMPLRTGKQSMSVGTTQRLPYPSDRLPARCA